MPPTSEEPEWMDSSLRIANAVHATMVCHRWRTVALGYPLIWAYCVDFDTPDGAKQLYLDRSNPCPLEIRSYCLSREAFLDITSGRHADRIRTIEVDCDHMLRLKDVVSFLSKERPNLEILNLTGCPFEDFVLSGELFKNTPNLRKLAIQYCVIFHVTTLPVSIRHGLTHLRLSVRGGTYLSPLSVHQWLALLSEMQNLSQIDLETDMFAPHDWDHEANQPPVRLPMIHAFRLNTGTPQTAAAFLSCVNMPNVSDWRLCVKNMRPDAIFDRVLIQTHKFLHQMWPTIIARSPTIFINETSITLRTFSEAEWEFPHSMLPCWSLELCAKQLHEGDIVIPQVLIFARSLLSITSDSILKSSLHPTVYLAKPTFEYDGARRTFSILFMALENVEMIDLSEYGASEEANAASPLFQLWSDQLAVAREGREKVPMPKLMGLNAPNFLSAWGGSDTIERLIEFLERRAEMGLKVDYIIFIRAILTRLQTDLMRNLVEIRGELEDAFDLYEDGDWALDGGSEATGTRPDEEITHID